MTVQYAQNGITTDLIDFGSKRMTVDSKGRVYSGRAEVGNAYLCNAFRSAEF